MRPVQNTAPSDQSSLTPEKLAKRLERERKAKETAEKLLAEQTRRLFMTNKALEKVAENLEGQRQQLNTILDHTFAGIFLVNDRLTVLQTNKAGSEMFDLSGDGLIDLRVVDLFDRAPQIERLLRIKFANGVDNVRFETEAVCEDGRKFPVEIGVSGVAKSNGRGGTVWIVNDITRRKREEERRKTLEKELSQAQKLEALGTLASGVAHEINTPVQYVGDNMRFLRDSLSDISEIIQLYKSGASKDEIEAKEDDADLEFLLEEIPAAIDQSINGLKQVARIVKAIKEFSHPGDEDIEDVDLNEAIETTLTVTRNQWKFVAKVDLDLAENLPTAPCCQGDINQVLLNMIVNAADAIAEKGETENGVISIKTREENGMILIEIADTGCGMPPEIMERMYDPFFTTKDVGKGTGQGLAISYKIIRTKHNGDILCDSMPGKGTRFTIQIPISPDAHIHSEEVA